MMSSQSNRPGGKIYIPPCKNVICESWVHKISECLDMDCVTTHKINGSFRNHFKQHFQECDFTVLHFCPDLWKRISVVEETFRNDEDKVILVRFTDERLTERNGKASAEENLGLEKLFDEFDSEQIIDDNAQTLQSFKDNVLSSLSDSKCQNIASYSDPQPSFVTLTEGYEMEDTCMEEEEGSDVTFENYPDFNSIITSLKVCNEMIMYDDRKEISFAPKDRKKAIQKINELDFTKEEAASTLTTLKYVLREMIPDCYKKKDFDLLASFSMCRHLAIFERALDSLELLLWEKVDQAQDFKILTNTLVILTEALTDLSRSCKTTNDNGYLLRMLQRVANLYLIVSGSLLVKCHDTPDIANKCYNYFDTRSQTPFTSFKPTDFDLEKQFDADLSLSVLDSVMKGAKDCKQKSPSRILQGLAKPEDLFGKMIKKGVAVHLLVVTHLLREVFSLDKDRSQNALNILEKYMDGPIDKSPFVFTILHSLTLFLVYKTEKMTHEDITKICKDTILVIEKAIPNGYVEQVDDFLQRLLFNSNPTIRQYVIKLFKDTDRYGLLPEFLQKKMEQQLSPLLTINIKVQNASDKQWQYGWNKASGDFNRQDVRVLFYSMNEKDHKNNQTAFTEKDLPFTEMNRLASLQHRNVIKLFAYQRDCIPQFYITENCEQHLQKHLENKMKNKDYCKPSELLQFLLDAVTGLEYCHKNDHVHCNLTAESMIVFDKTRVKLAGFGLSKKIDPSTGKAIDINCKEIPLRWSAPESILKGEYSKASDIWMVGLALCEVMTHGLLPYSDMAIDEEKLIEQMKLKELKPTFKPVVGSGREELRRGLLRLLSDCTSYVPESRIYVANVKTTLENIRRSAEGITGIKVPVVPDEKLSKHCKRGIPEKFHKRTMVQAATEIIHIIPGKLERMKEGEDFIFREKLKPNISPAMETDIASPKLDDILPPRGIVQYASEMKHIECKIPRKNCYCLLDAAFKKKINTVEEIMFFMQKVSVMLADLSKHRYVIGDICASSVYVELSDTPKAHIISLGYLKTIDCEDEELGTTDELIPEIKRRASPEVIKHRHFSSATDVFCFGNFMWELLAAFSQQSTSMFFNNNVKIFKKLDGNKLDEQIHDAILNGEWTKHHPKPKRCPDRLYKLITSCVSAEEVQRPSMDQVAVQLQGFCSNSPGGEGQDQQNRHSLTSLVEVNPSESSGSTASSSTA